MKVRRRQGRTLNLGIPGGGVSAREGLGRVSASEMKVDGHAGDEADTTFRKTLKAVSVLVGRNQETCESLVSDFSSLAPRSGLGVAQVKEMDSAVDSLSTEMPTLIITPPYEGRPTDNAKKFVAWVEGMAAQGKKLPEGVEFAVFGAVNSDWAHTFHRIPKLSQSLCVTISGESSAIGKIGREERAGVDVVIENANSVKVTSQQGPGGEPILLATVVAHRELAAASSFGASKRHIDLRLPLGTTYRSGGCVVVRGENSAAIVSHVMKRFNLGPEDVMKVPSSTKTFLPSQPMAITEFLKRNVELATPITKKQLSILASWADRDRKESYRLGLMQEDYIYQQLLDRRYSLLDVLEDVPRLKVPFGVYINLLVPLAPRTYSISSSPMDPHSLEGSGVVGPAVSLTFDLLESPAMSGHGTFQGVASSYLASRSTGDRVFCQVCRANRASAKTTGNVELGPALLFFGCRNPADDYLYREEFEAWEKDGIVEVIACFSRPADGRKGEYVQSRLWEARDRVWSSLQEGARVYICGSAARLGMSSTETFRKICREKTGKTEVETLEWLEKIKDIQYISDVY
ncbi:NADPH-ferrihemoprotein reductase [Geosmithia morbida]|uniref:NADPH--hemoprotein reductase n=1 Tax=Geosmithia morbida TaxID=1094350 RepID=A0A9P4YMK2_9HYPO|nr:NADPH-ferrihemoprotein reductase [Geosmithia morbida]KAF4119340.1 NADPH-ferrihemoprotein reductase [Geosmithia morbida]